MPSVCIWPVIFQKKKVFRLISDIFEIKMLFCFFSIGSIKVHFAAKKRKLVLPQLSLCKYLMFGELNVFFFLFLNCEKEKWINKKKKKENCGMQSIATFQLNRNRSIESMSKQSLSPKWSNIRTCSQDFSQRFVQFIL